MNHKTAINNGVKNNIGPQQFQNNDSIKVYNKQRKALNKYQSTINEAIMYVHDSKTVNIHNKIIRQFMRCK